MKKTEYITYRTDAATKAILAGIAAEKKWSIEDLQEMYMYYAALVIKMKEEM